MSRFNSISCILLVAGVLFIGELQAEPRFVATRWEALGDTLQELAPGQITDTGEYRLRFTRNIAGTETNRFVAVTEISRINSSEQQSVSLTSVALDLYNVAGLGDDAQEQDEITAHLTGGTVLDFRFRIEFLGNGQAHLFLTSLVPGRPGAWGDWELSTQGVVVEQLKSQYPEILVNQRVAPVLHTQGISKRPVDDSNHRN